MISVRKFKNIINSILTVILMMAAVALFTFSVDHIANHMRKESFDETNIVQMTNNGYIDLYVDQETNVIYVRAVNGTLTPMVNADGTPKLWQNK